MAKSYILASLKQKHRRKNEMQGSFVDAKEKFQVKKKDPVKNKIKKADRAWREKRKNRHETA